MLKVLCCGDISVNHSSMRHQHRTIVLTTQISNIFSLRIFFIIIMCILEPPKLNKYAIIILPKTSEHPQRTETRFNVHFCGKCLLDNRNGEITSVAMVICKTGVACEQGINVIEV